MGSWGIKNDNKTQIKYFYLMSLTWFAYLRMRNDILMCGGWSKILVINISGFLLHNSFWLINNRIFFDSIVMLDYNAASTAKSREAVTCRSSLNTFINESLVSCAHPSLAIHIAHQCNLTLISVDFRSSNSSNFVFALLH